MQHIRISTTLGLTEISNFEKKLIGIAILLSVLARGSSFVIPTFNIDDLWYLAAIYDYNTVGFIGFREGRFTGPILAFLQSNLGIDAPKSPTISSAVMSLALGFTAVLVCRLWGIKQDLWAGIAVVIFVVAHPFQTDMFTWKITQMNGGLPFVFIMAALLLSNVGTLAFAVSVALIVFALGIHQIPLQFAATALVLAVPIRVMQGSFSFRRWLIEASSLTAGTAVYAVFALISMRLASPGTLGRDSIIIFSHPSVVIDRFIELLRITPGAVNLSGPLAVLALVAIGAFALWTALRSPTNAALTTAALVLSVPLAVACAYALSVVTAAWIPVYRNMASVSLVFAAVAVIAMSGQSKMIRKATAVLCCILAFQYTAVGNEMLSDLQRANARDAALMVRISSDVDRAAPPSEVKRLLFIGSSTEPLKSLRTAADLSTGWNNYGSTLSVFSVPWNGYLQQLYNEITGRRVGYSVSEAENHTAEQYCSDRRWPELGSVSRSGDLVVVCLSPAVAPVRSRLQTDFQ